MSLIRAIIVGNDPKDGMRFQIGTRIMRRCFEVVDIIESENEFKVYIKKVEEDHQDHSIIGETMLWKRVLKTMPIMVELSIEY